MSENTSRRDELHDVGAVEAKEPSGGTGSAWIDSRQLFGDRDENAQADFERIDHENADAAVPLTMDGTVEGTPITDFSLSWYKLVEPGLGEPFTMAIDVTESVKRLLTEGASFSGFVISCSPDGEFCLASVDLVDDVRGKVYLPKLVLQTSLE